MSLRLELSAGRRKSPAPLTPVSAVIPAIFVAAESDTIDWSLAFMPFLGLALGFLVSWLLARHTRRVAHEQATELVEVARREAAVAAEEMRQKAEVEIQEKRTDFNREFDRREIETDVQLREIRAHEESLALLDY